MSITGVCPPNEKSPQNSFATPCVEYSTPCLTPNAALLKFKGSANLTVEQVLKRRSEMLTTHKLNVISVHAEPGVVAMDKIWVEHIRKECGKLDIPF